LLISFANTRIDGSTLPIDDDAGGTWHAIFSNTSHAHLVPDDLTGVLIVAGVGANTYTAAEVELYSAAAATEPYIITGIVFEPAAGERYGLRLSADGGTTYFWEGVVEAAAGRSNRLEFIPIPMNQGTQIVGSVRSETGGNNLLIWLKITHY
jgi:hypothetical protein